MTSPIPLKFVENVMKFENCEHDGATLFRKDLAPGSAHWIGSVDKETAALDFTCPCGCGTVHCLPVCTEQKVDREWLWDGNKELPTLTPSIQCTTPCRWHGFLTAGVFVPC